MFIGINKFFIVFLSLFVIGNFRSVVLTVGGITPLLAILRGKGAMKPKGEIGEGNNTKGQNTLNR